MAKAHSADLSEHEYLNKALSELAEAGIVLSAPKGVGVVSPRAVRLGSGESSVGLMAGTNVDLSAMKKITLAAGESVGIFAHKKGIKLYANQGKVEAEAQNDGMHLTSRKEMEICSTESRVEITAKEELVLSCGGAYIKLSNGGVEIGGPRNILLKSSNVQKMGALSLLAQMAELPESYNPSQYKGKFQVIDEITKEPLTNTNYAIKREDGSVEYGVTDDNGYTHQVKNDESSEKIEIYLEN